MAGGRANASPVAMAGGGSNRTRSAIKSQKRLELSGSTPRMTRGKAVASPRRALQVLSDNTDERPASSAKGPTTEMRPKDAEGLVRALLAEADSEASKEQLAKIAALLKVELAPVNPLYTPDGKVSATQAMGMGMTPHVTSAGPAATDSRRDSLQPGGVGPNISMASLLSDNQESMGDMDLSIEVQAQAEKIEGLLKENVMLQEETKRLSEQLGNGVTSGTPGDDEQLVQLQVLEALCADRMTRHWTSLRDVRASVEGRLTAEAGVTLEPVQDPLDEDGLEGLLACVEAESTQLARAVSPLLCQLYEATSARDQLSEELEESMEATRKLVEAEMASEVLAAKQALEARSAQLVALRQEVEEASAAAATSSAGAGVAALQAQLQQATSTHNAQVLELNKQMAATDEAHARELAEKIHSVQEVAEGRISALQERLRDAKAAERVEDARAQLEGFRAEATEREGRLRQELASGEGRRAALEAEITALRGQASTKKAPLRVQAAEGGSGEAGAPRRVVRDDSSDDDDSSFDGGAAAAPRASGAEPRARATVSVRREGGVKVLDVRALERENEHLVREVQRQAEEIESLLCAREAAPTVARLREDLARMQTENFDLACKHRAGLARLQQVLSEDEKLRLQLKQQSILIREHESKLAHIKAQQDEVVAQVATNATLRTMRADEMSTRGQTLQEELSRTRAQLQEMEDVLFMQEEQLQRSEGERTAQERVTKEAETDVLRMHNMMSEQLASIQQVLTSSPSKAGAVVPAAGGGADVDLCLSGLLDQTVVQSLEEQLSEAQVSLDTERANADGLAKQLQQTAARASDLRARLSQTQASHDAATALASERAAELRELRSKSSKAEEELARAQEWLNEALRRGEALKEEREALQRDVTSLARQLNDRSETAARYEAQLSERCAAEKRLESQLAERSAAVAQLEARLAEARQRGGAADVAGAEQLEEVARLRGENAYLVQDTQEKAEAIEALEHERESLLGEAHTGLEMSAELASMSKRLQEHLVALARMKDVAAANEGLRVALSQLTGVAEGMDARVRRGYAHAAEMDRRLTDMLLHLAGAFTLPPPPDSDAAAPAAKRGRPSAPQRGGAEEAEAAARGVASFNTIRLGLAAVKASAQELLSALALDGDLAPRDAIARSGSAMRASNDGGASFLVGQGDGVGSGGDGDDSVLDRLNAQLGRLSEYGSSPPPKFSSQAGPSSSSAERHAVYARAVDRLKQLKSENRQVWAALEGQVRASDKWATRVASDADRIVALEAEVAARGEENARLQQATRDNEGARMELARMAAEIAKVQAEWGEAKKRLGTRESRIAELEARLGAAQGSLNQREAEVERLEAAAAQHHRDHEALRAQAREQASRLRTEEARLLGEAGDLRAEVSRLEGAVASRAGEVEGLRREAAAKEEAHRATEERAADLRRQLHESVAAASLNAAEIDMLRQEVAAKADAHLQAEQRASELQRRLEVVQGEHSVDVVQVSQLRAQIEVAETEARRMGAEAEEAKAAARSSEKTMRSAEEAVRSAEAATRSAEEAARREAQARAADLENARLEAASAQRRETAEQTARGTEVAGLQAALGAVQAMLETRGRELEDLREDAKRARSEHAMHEQAFEAEVSHLKKQLDVARLALEANRTEMGRVEREDVASRGADVAKAEAELQGARGELSAREAELAKMQAAVGEGERAAAAQGREIEAVRAELTAVRGALQEAHDREARAAGLARSENAGLQERAAAQKAELAMAREEVQRLQRDLASRSEYAATVQAQVLQHAEHVGRLQAELAARRGGEEEQQQERADEVALLQLELAARSESVRCLEQEVTRLRRERDESAELASRLQVEIAGEAGAAEAREADAEEALSALARREAELAALREELRVLHADAQRLRGETGEEASSLRGQLEAKGAEMDGLKADANAAEAAAEALRGELRAREAEVDGLKAELAAAAAATEVLRGELKGAEGRFEAAEAAEASRKEELEAARAEAGDLAVRVGELEEQLGLARGTLEEVQAEHARCSETDVPEGGGVDGGAAEVRRLRKEWMSLKQQLLEREEEIKRLQSPRRNRNAADLQRQLASKDAEAEALAEESAGRAAVVAELEVAVAVREGDLASLRGTLEGRVSELQTELDSREADLSSARAECERLRQKSERTAGEVLRYKEALEGASSAMEGAARGGSEMRSEVDSLRARIATLEGELAAAGGRADTAERELAEREQIVGLLVEENRDLKARVRELEAEVEVGARRSLEAAKLDLEVSMPSPETPGGVRARRALDPLLGNNWNLMKAIEGCVAPAGPSGPSPSTWRPKASAAETPSAGHQPAAPSDRPPLSPWAAGKTPRAASTPSARPSSSKEKHAAAAAKPAAKGRKGSSPPQPACEEEDDLAAEGGEAAEGGVVVARTVLHKAKKYKAKAIEASTRAKQLEGMLSQQDRRHNVQIIRYQDELTKLQLSLQEMSMELHSTRQQHIESSTVLREVASKGREEQTEQIHLKNKVESLVTLIHDMRTREEGLGLSLDDFSMNSTAITVGPPTPVGPSASSSPPGGSARPSKKSSSSSSSSSKKAAAAAGSRSKARGPRTAGAGAK